MPEQQLNSHEPVPSFGMLPAAGCMTEFLELTASIPDTESERSLVAMGRDYQGEMETEDVWDLRRMIYSNPEAGEKISLFAW